MLIVISGPLPAKLPLKNLPEKKFYCLGTVFENRDHEDMDEIPIFFILQAFFKNRQSLSDTLVETFLYYCNFGLILNKSFICFYLVNHWSRMCAVLLIPRYPNAAIRGHTFWPLCQNITEYSTFTMKILSYHFGSRVIILVPSPYICINIVRHW